MADFRAPAVDHYTAIDGVVQRQWFEDTQKFLQKVAKLDEVQIYTVPQRFQNAAIQDSAILLTTEKYSSLINVNKVSRNAVDARSGGGNAAIYVQHLVDASTTARNNVNVGVRAQIESYQTRSAGGLVNDLVGFYGGVYNGGVDVGGFGMHVDAYHAGTGAASSFYGFNAEMFRTSAAGFTVAYHARSIDGGATYKDNDFAFLASPSPGGARRFVSLFAGGSTQTGTMACDYGLDLRNANAAVASISLPAGIPVYWDGNVGANIKQLYDVAGVWKHFVAGVYQFGVENTGRLFIVNNANTVYAISGAASGNFLAINIGGVVYKITLNTF